MPEFKKIQDLLTTENPTKAVVLDDNNELKLADYAGGGTDSGTIFIECTINEDDTFDFIDPEMNFNKIKQLHEEGKNLKLLCNSDGTQIIIPLTVYAPENIEEEEPEIFMFSGVLNILRPEQIYFMVTPQGNQIMYEPFDVLPEVTEYDEDMILAVVDGEWKASDADSNTVELIITIDSTFTNLTAKIDNEEVLYNEIKEKSRGKNLKCTVYATIQEDSGDIDHVRIEQLQLIDNINKNLSVVILSPSSEISFNAFQCIIGKTEISLRNYNFSLITQQPS